MKVDLSVALIAATMFCSSTAISSLKEPLVNIFVSSYNHSVTSFRLTPQERVPWALQTTEVTQDCGINPSWLTFDTSKRYLYCLNEGINQNTGSVTALSVSKSGSFTTIGKKSLLPGPVSGYLSRRGTSSALFVAHYSPSAVSVIDTINFSSDDLIQSIRLPKTNSSAHQVLFDPTNQFLLVPDLMANLIRIYKVDERLRLNEMTSLVMSPGTGPRHATWWSPDPVKVPNGGPLFLIVNGELSCIVSVYRVTYNGSKESLSFTLVSQATSLDRDISAKKYTTAEIAVSPDNKYVMVSNRLDNSSTYKCNPATGNGISCASDTLTTFRPTFNELDGSMKLELVQMHAAGGSKPRHFAFNKAGDLVAVALEDSNTISIIARNVRSGLLTEFMTIQRVADRPNMVLWDEL